MRFLSIVSGTSTDGLTFSLIDIDGYGLNTEYSILKTETYLYSKEMRSDLLKIASNKDVSAEFVSKVHWDLGRMIERFASGFSDSFDIIAYSGHTVYHGPSSGNVLNGTYQLGEISVLAARSGKTAVSEFRPVDMAYGGLGAPLTVVPDYFILKEPGTLGLNIGGISNIAYVGEKSLLGFDTGPGNMLIDLASLKFFSKEFDRNGLLASKGKIDEGMLKYLMEDPYLKIEPPKTSGREYFSESYLENLLTVFKDVEAHDFVRTITRFTSESIHDQVERFVEGNISRIVAGGGGTLNPVILSDLRELFNSEVLTFSDIGVDSMSRECLGFAILANQTLNLQPGRLTNIEKMEGEVIGKITPGRNYRNILKELIH